MTPDQMSLAEREKIIAKVRAQMVEFLRTRPMPHGNARPMFDDNGERLYRESEAAEMIGCSKGTIGNWCRDGWIPKSRRGRYHAFKLHQVGLLAKFFEVPSHNHDWRSEVSKYIWENWN